MGFTQGDTSAHGEEPMKEQYKAAVPETERREGWLYDADSGVLMGLASVELKQRHQPGVVFTMTFAGCPHKVIIHKAPISIPTVLL